MATKMAAKTEVADLTNEITTNEKREAHASGSVAKLASVEEKNTSIAETEHDLELNLEVNGNGHSKNMATCIQDDSSVVIQDMQNSSDKGNTAVFSSRKRSLSSQSADETVNKKVKSSSVGKKSSTDNTIKEGERKTTRARRSLAGRPICTDDKVKDKKSTKSAILKQTKRSKETNPRDISKQLSSRAKNQKSAKTSGRVATGDLSSTSADNHSFETTTILAAMADLKAGIDSKMDQIDNSNKEAIRMVQEEIGSIRKEFNSRIDGLARKVEDRVRKVFEKDIQEAVEKVAAKSKAKLEKAIKTNEQSIKRIEQTVISTTKEEIGDEIDALIQHVKNVEKTVYDSKAKTDTEELRKRRIVVRNLREREDENIVDRVNSVIDYLKVRVEVVAATRKESKSSSKPGIVIATLRSKDEKEQIMRAKKDLRNSNRYKDVYIEHDIPSYHRRIRNNLHTIVNTLGQEKLEMKGSRVFMSEQSRSYGEGSHYGYRPEEPRKHYSQESSYRDSHYDGYRQNDRRSNYRSHEYNRRPDDSRQTRPSRYNSQ